MYVVVGRLKPAVGATVIAASGAILMSYAGTWDTQKQAIAQADGLARANQSYEYFVAQVLTKHQVKPTPVTIETIAVCK